MTEKSLRWFQQLRCSQKINWNKTYLFGVTCPFSVNHHGCSISSLDNGNSDNNTMIATATISKRNNNYFANEVVDETLITFAKELLKLQCDGMSPILFVVVSSF